MKQGRVRALAVHQTIAVAVACFAKKTHVVSLSMSMTAPVSAIVDCCRSVVL